MTAHVAAFPSPFLMPSAALSAEARLLTSRACWADDGSPSIALESRIADAFVNLVEACMDASRADWDGYGAAPVSPLAYIAAEEFLLSVPSEFPMPEIAVHPDGEIELEWFKDARHVFSISVGSPYTATYAGLFGDSRVHGTERSPSRIAEVVAQNLARLYPSALASQRSPR